MDKIPLASPELSSDAVEALRRALSTERFVGGESVELFEREFARFVGTKHAVSVNSGTSGLLASLIALRVKRGDIVITTPATFVATANAIVLSGAVPAFADVSPVDYNIDVESIRKILRLKGKKVRAILPVHLYGRPCNLAPIIELANEAGVPVLEDACQAHGASVNGKQVGSFGTAGVFSFYSSKNLIVGGDGGMVTTNDAEVAQALRELRDAGRRTHEPTYLHFRVGFNFRLNTINAAIGREQLKLLPKENQLRARIASRYIRELGSSGPIQLPPPDTSHSKSSWHLFVVSAKKRDDLRSHLSAERIETGIHYPLPIPNQPAYKNIKYYAVKSATASRWAREVLSLPVFPAMSGAALDRVTNVVSEFYTDRS